MADRRTNFAIYHDTQPRVDDMFRQSRPALQEIHLSQENVQSAGPHKPPAMAHGPPQAAVIRPAPQAPLLVPQAPASPTQDYEQIGDSRMEEATPDVNAIEMVERILNDEEMAIEQAQVEQNVITDIDALYSNDPQFATHYITSIIANMFDAQNKYRCDSSYMGIQRDINATMRGILVDWLVEVGEEYRLHSETLHLAVNYIDRFLSRTQVMRGKLQLVGITAMLIAAKYEEIYPPTVEDFVYISDNTYLHDDVIKMERSMLNSLDFELTAVTSNAFIKRFARAAAGDVRVECLASYLAELTLQDQSFLDYAPSMVAAAAVSLASLTLGLPRWTPTLEHYTGYSEAEIEACVSHLHRVYRASPNSNLQASKEKYSHGRLHRVSSVVPPEVI